MKMIIKVFVDNPGGAYDPAPLDDLDLGDGSFLPVIGDILRWDDTLPAYKVIARFVDLSTNRCALKVEENNDIWPI